MFMYRYVNKNTFDIIYLCIFVLQFAVIVTDVSDVSKFEYCC